MHFIKLLTYGFKELQFSKGAFLRSLYIVARRESNPNQKFRKLPFYPLNYRAEKN